MRKPILVLALLLPWASSFGQSNNEPLGGKTETKATATTKKSAPKPSAKESKPLASPCGVYYKRSADISAESNLPDKWFSLGESANKHFWYNPRKTNCDVKTGSLKSWLKEEHKNTAGNYALVLYEFKCSANQIRVKTAIEYDNTGSVLETNDHENDPWQNVAPGTAGEVMIRTVCRRP
jgi:Surface-adhesin protein E